LVGDRARKIECADVMIACWLLDAIARKWFGYERVLAARRQRTSGVFCGLSMILNAAPSSDSDITRRAPIVVTNILA
jgi:hypothetical protein